MPSPEVEPLRTPRWPPHLRCAAITTGVVLVVAVALFAASGDVGLGIFFAGIVPVVYGIYLLVRRRRQWALATLIGGVGAGIAGLIISVVQAPAAPEVAAPAPTVAASPAPTSGTSPSPTPTPSSTPSPTPTPKPSPSPTRTPSPSPTPRTSPTSPTPNPQPEAGTALAAARTLVVKGRAPKTGYDRDEFGSGWATKSNGCSTREVVLRRDLSPVKVLAGTGGCRVVGSRFLDPYSGETMAVTSATVSSIDIDHVVPLADAWQKGAQSWSSQKRVAFANDLVNLLATSESLNSQKSDGDAATWLPPNHAFRCAYIARQVTVKKKYGLWVTRAEKDAMIRILSSCPNKKLVTATQARQKKDPTAQVVQPEREAPEHTRPPQGGGRLDPRFGTCSQAIAAGYGPYVRGQDPEYYWYRDADHDGIVCER